jgi:NAD(P)-dependent dehydrogenase (short-subunit alcohol dehydrogenase family)
MGVSIMPGAMQLTRTPNVDILHNNVGIVPAGRTEDLPAGSWRHGFEVNLTGMWMTCKYVLPHMRERGSGAIVNISSMAGLLAGGEAIAYTTSKTSIQKVGAAELRLHGRVSRCSGPVRTDLASAV